jgi:hypothetical protein
MKAYNRRRAAGFASSRTLDSKNIIQRGQPGIFIGFPINQPGYLVHIPSTREIYASMDVYFDEHFESNLQYSDQLYQGSLPIRHTRILHDDSLPQARLTHPIVRADDVDPSDPWPQRPFFDLTDVLTEILSPEEECFIINHDAEANFDDVYAEEEQVNDIIAEEETIQNDRPLVTSDIGQRNRTRNRRPNSRYFNDSLVNSAQVHRAHSDSRNFASYNNSMAASIVGASVSANDPYFSEALDTYVNAVSPASGQPGSDPSIFLPEPRGLYEVLRLPPRMREPWMKAFRAEFIGLVQMGTFKPASPGPTDTVVPLMDVYKCKLNPRGEIEKFKSRWVFRGDLFNNKPDNLLRDTTTHDRSSIDTYCPHATMISVKFFLAESAGIHQRPWQADMIQAYVNVDIDRPGVYVKLPAYWKPHVPPELQHLVGVPLELAKALYGYSAAGLCLYNAQAQFFEEQGLQKHVIIGIWFKHLPNGGLFILIHFSDDLMSSCTDEDFHRKFRDAFAARFATKWTPNASWFLSARISQDADGNISIDQYRYSRAIVARYLPNADSTPSREDLIKYRDPLPTSFQWSARDKSPSEEKAQELAQEFNFRLNEVVGSLSYLTNTTPKLLYATRKAAKYASMPGLKHFKAVTHLLHHLRCYPPQPIVFYRDPTQSPLAQLLQHANLPKIDPQLVLFTDSAFMDCDGSKSTGCTIVMYRGGCIDAISGVPGLVADSTGEAETVWCSITMKASAYFRQAYCQLHFGDPDRPLTVPILTDSTAALAILSNDRNSSRTRHMDRRHFYNKNMPDRALASLHHVDGDLYELADIGTKNLPSSTSDPKLHVIHGGGAIDPTTGDIIPLRVAREQRLRNNLRSPSLPGIPGQSRRSDGIHIQHQHVDRYHHNG